MLQIHHVDGNGQDGGTAFGEVRAKAFNPLDLLRIELNDLLYPGRCGYKWETGGTVKNLRTETNMEKIRQYHAKFYRPENMIIIVNGHVDKKALFEAIRPVEEEEAAKKRVEFERPFQTPCPNLPGNGVIQKTVEYPDGK